MSTRYYFAKAKISDIDKIKDISYGDIVKMLNKNSCDEDMFCPLDEIISIKDVFNFNKLDENTISSISKMGYELFTNKDTIENLGYDPFVIDLKGLYYTISIYESKILKYLKELKKDSLEIFVSKLNDSENMEKSKKTIVDIYNYFESVVKAWENNRVLDLKNPDFIADDYLFEYYIMQLNYIAKSTDWDTYKLLFYCW